ncbi:hypothetical protein FUAX_40830 (plasmid) [Fulvitalea axinellae]|uniref:Tail assembly chaperone n=1 Tax=Fulvitalea axinellae TaxID=1182444 RepID=A0AAU9DEL2_9BACT|nr:hypothetical protein FUAX_40830 [Fulvitalea axinellae]
MADKTGNKDAEAQEFKVPKACEADVRAWKEKHGKVKYLDMDGKALFFRMPTRQEMAAAENLAEDENGRMDSYKKAEKLFVDCFLGGELTLEQVLDDVEVYMAVTEYCLFRLVERKNVSWGSC